MYCVMLTPRKSGTCMIIINLIYGDDMLKIGNKEIIEELKTKVEEVLSIKTEEKLTDYLDCEFHMNNNNTKGWLGQPSITKKFGK